jgi:hypothetical protein
MLGEERATAPALSARLARVLGSYLHASEQAEIPLEKVRDHAAEALVSVIEVAT